ncbi:MAG: DUF4340 domain-containing protein [Gammaproteobacteria bacterium]|nr:DUF4340 domain-containing protein [Gammaproteobacteria bacterium]
MRSQLLTNLFLLVLAIGLGLFLFYDELEQDEIKKLTELSASDINRIHIQHQQRVTVLTKSDRQWRLTQPIEIAANQFRIKTLLSILETASDAQYASDELELKKFGLANAETSITFNDRKIEFGTLNPVTGYRYVKTGDQLHLIDDHFYPLLSSQIGTLIATELLPGDAAISKLVLPDDVLSRDEQGHWQSRHGILSEAVADTVYQWTHKQAFAVHDYMPRESLGEIEVFLENSQTPVRFSITDEAPWLIIARPELELEYHFNLEESAALLKPGTAKAPDDDSQSETLRVSPDEFLHIIQLQ